MTAKRYCQCHDVDRCPDCRHVWLTAVFGEGQRGAGRGPEPDPRKSSRDGGQRLSGVLATCPRREFEDKLGHLGYALVGAGMLALAFSDPYGWSVRLSGELIWVWLGFRMRMTSIWSWGLAFACIDAIGAFRALQ